LQITPYIFKSFGFGPLKQKSAAKFAGNQRIFLQILTLGTKIKMICIYRD
jgi:hypothetical protein